jgi:uncharacterized damage-inducible protein DinB
MNSAISIQKLLDWSHESATFWKAHFDTNPALLQLACGIDDTPNVQELVRHIWMAELRWAQRVAGLPVVPRADLPTGPLEALFGFHQQAAQIVGTLVNDPAYKWDQTITLEFDWLPPHARTASRRKMLAHGLLHSQRHWAQLATLVRVAGFPSNFLGDLIFSQALV